jgi:DNA uptake protein ComE-like DNA-binding protein
MPTAQTTAESEAVAEVLNTAKRDELMEVPGIGKATAKRVIKNRPYESAEEAVEEGVLPESTLERVKDQLVDKGKDRCVNSSV